MTDRDANDYHATRARFAAERRARERRNGARRLPYLLGAIVAGIVGLGVWLKPPLEAMREGVDEGLRAWAAEHAEAGAAPALTHEESHDWVLAVSHTAQVGEATFSCWGAFKVTVCNLPDE